MWLRFKCINVKYITEIDILGIKVKITLEKMSEDLVDDKSTLVQVMAMCRQAKSHYPNQNRASSPTPYASGRVT